MKSPNVASWEDVADWYSEYLETTENSYQRRVVLPNLLRILNIKKGVRLLDIACGQGFFSRAFAKAGAKVTGLDISESLIAEAKKLSPAQIKFHVSSANKMGFAKDASFELATIVLALQNIEDVAGTLKEAARVLVPRGRMVIVLTHPAFRVPKRSSWGWDEKTKTQYRRVDTYLSLSKENIVAHPGKKNSPQTISYHRSLQDISKALFGAGFVISKLEEWISHKQSEAGPRQKAENISRKEIPLFLTLGVSKR